MPSALSRKLLCLVVTCGAGHRHSRSCLGPRSMRNSKIVGGLLPKETPPQQPGAGLWFRHDECRGPVRPFASTEMAAGLPSWVSHRKGKCVDPFVALPNYVVFLVVVLKI